MPIVGCQNCGHFRGKYPDGDGNGVSEACKHCTFGERGKPMSWCPDDGALGAWLERPCNLVGYTVNEIVGMAVINAKDIHVSRIPPFHCLWIKEEESV